MTLSQLSRGALVVVEGLDGSGKTTLVQSLSTWVQGLGYAVEDYRQPGGTSYAEHLRGLLKLDESSKQITIAREAVACTMTAAAVDLLAQRVVPALAQRKVVILDRHYPSLIAYQFHGNGVTKRIIDALVDVQHSFATPDVVLYLDVNTEVAVQRQEERVARGERTQTLTDSYLKFVQVGYLEQLNWAYHHPLQRPYWHCLDADQRPEVVLSNAQMHVQRLLNELEA